MKNKIIVLLLFSLAKISLGQSIRKSFNEMTPSEKNAYKTALSSMQIVMQKLGCLHSYHFYTENSVHGGEYFFPWHRWFQYEFEKQLRNAGTANAQNLSVPYWDWRTPYSATDAWTNVNFLGSFNTPWNLGRIQTGAVSVQNTPQSINSIMSNTAFSSFTSNMEGIHGSTHGYVGGIMGGGYSPYDPVFFTHHGMIDKLWQEWEDARLATNTPRTVFSVDSTILHNHDATYTCFPDPLEPEWRRSPFTVTTDIQTPHFNIKHVIDARRQDFNQDGIVDNEAWYAYNKKLLLNGISGTFSATGTKNYCYVAWNPTSSITQGSIHVGNVKRDASDNVVAGNLGGFKVADGARVEIHTANSITFYPGFSSGVNSVLTASLVQNPCGFSSSFRTEGSEEIGLQTEAEDLGEITVYPNPNTTGVLNFSKIADNFKLVNTSGVEVLKGNNTDQISVDGLSKGLYLLHIDGKAMKVVIE